MVEDIASINRGEAVRYANDYVVNGRRYRQKSGASGGGSYPVDGPGVHRLTRGEFKALGLYNELGDSPRLDGIFSNMELTISEREKAFHIWKRERGKSTDVD
jgi:hypothetical protein